MGTDKLLWAKKGSIYPLILTCNRIKICCRYTRSRMRVCASYWKRSIRNRVNRSFLPKEKVAKIAHRNRTRNPSTATTTSAKGALIAALQARTSTKGSKSNSSRASRTAMKSSTPSICYQRKNPIPWPRSTVPLRPVKIKAPFFRIKLSCFIRICVNLPMSWRISSRRIRWMV